MLHFTYIVSLLELDSLLSIISELNKTIWSSLPPVYADLLFDSRLYFDIDNNMYFRMVQGQNRWDQT